MIAENKRVKTAELFAQYFPAMIHEVSFICSLLHFSSSCEPSPLVPLLHFPYVAVSLHTLIPLLHLFVKS